MTRLVKWFVCISVLECTAVYVSLCVCMAWYGCGATAECSLRQDTSGLTAQYKAPSLGKQLPAQRRLRLLTML
jgi:hypothetical protein